MWLYNSIIVSNLFYSAETIGCCSPPHMAKKRIRCLPERQGNKRGSQGTNWTIKHREHKRRLYWFGHLIWFDHQRIPQQAFYRYAVMKGSEFQEGIRLAVDKQERRKIYEEWDSSRKRWRQQPSTDKRI